MKQTIIFSNYDDLLNPFYGGGGARAIHETAKRLVGKFNVVIVTGNYPGAVAATIDGIKYLRSGIKFGGPKLGQLLFSLTLPYLIKKLTFDVWIENFTPPFSTSFLPLFTKKPVVGLVHMLASEDMERKYKIPFHILENIGLKKYKNFIVTQNSTALKIKSIHKKAKIGIIPNGVNSPSYTGRHQSKHILFLGRIEINQKGLDLLLDAFRQVKKRGIKLVLAGSGEKKEVKKLLDIIKEKKLERNVIYAGKVDGRDKEKLIKNAYFVVVPSRFETFSLVTLESLINKTPVISFNIPGLSWLPDKYALKAKPFDVDEISSYMKMLLYDPFLRKTIGKKGFEFASKFKWDNTADKYIQFINNS